MNNRSQVTTVGSSGNVDASGLEPNLQAFCSTDEVVMVSKYAAFDFARLI